MKRIFYIIAFCSISSVVQASESNPKFPTLKNPILPRADTLTGQIEHGKAQAKLVEVASNKSSTDSKIKMQIDTQKSYERAREIAEQDAYNQIILNCNNALNGMPDKNTLKSVRLNLYQILSSDRPQDKPILDQLQIMDKSLAKRYCFINPSANRIERTRAALYSVVNKRLLEINERNEMADDASSRSSSPVYASAPAQAVVVDPKTGHYQRWM